MYIIHEQQSMDGGSKGTCGARCAAILQIYQINGSPPSAPPSPTLSLTRIISSRIDCSAGIHSARTRTHNCAHTQIPSPLSACRSYLSRCSHTHLIYWLPAADALNQKTWQLFWRVGGGASVAPSRNSGAMLTSKWQSETDRAVSYIQPTNPVLCCPLWELVQPEFAVWNTAPANTSLQMTLYRFKDMAL